MKHQKTKSIGIIPARFQSSRFPGKPLQLIGGKAIIIRVIEQCLKSNLNDVVVATDDDRIAEVVIKNGYEVLLTPSHLQSGTERCFYAYQNLEKASDYLINIQGDEPFIAPSQINKTIALLEHKETQIATLFTHFKSEEDVKSPHKVKLVCDENGKALLFSRSVIPNPQKGFEISNYKKHIGIYGFKTEVISKINQLKPHPFEEAESLEQLRWLMNGFQIYTAFSSEVSLGIDTPEDLKAAEDYLKRLGE